MDEYINKEYLLDAMQAERERLRPLYDNYALGFEKGILLVKGFPYADVKLVRHGQWKMVGADKLGRGGNWQCTGSDGCGRLYPYKCDYCPNCGAKMDGDNNA